MGPKRIVLTALICLSATLSAAPVLALQANNPETPADVQDFKLDPPKETVTPPKADPVPESKAQTAKEATPKTRPNAATKTPIKAPAKVKVEKSVSTSVSTKKVETGKPAVPAPANPKSNAPAASAAVASGSEAAGEVAAEIPAETPTVREEVVQEPVAGPAPGAVEEPAASSDTAAASGIKGWLYSILLLAIPILILVFGFLFLRKRRPAKDYDEIGVSSFDPSNAEDYEEPQGEPQFLRATPSASVESKAADKTSTITTFEHQPEPPAASEPAAVPVEPPPLSTPEPTPAPTPAPEPAPEPEPTIIPAAVSTDRPIDRPEIEMAFVPGQARLGITRLDLSGTLRIANIGKAPATGLRLVSTLMSASSTQSEEIAAFHRQSAGQAGEVVADLGAGDRASLELELSIPLSELYAFPVGQQKLVVPIFAANLRFGAEESTQGQAELASLIGRDNGAGAKMGALRIDLGPREFADLAQRPVFA